ncbi:hypothetical protein LQ327_22635 [Actinomycetospora endophytica]|uniref:DUF6777 domain-containing protein n=1 Tax=Actinomycetospora endophytica TaxID=2291215 RepID=A0ABS8PDD8_9PSEU|nr:DUF6777 domain-containing protein [Actinomycetospora endophytica]MCD2196174.1 hypothetical protein [Actinomycetospora endophytica]
MGVTLRIHITRRSVGFTLAAIAITGLLISGVIVALAESTAAVNTLEPVNAADAYPFVAEAGADVGQPAGAPPGVSGKVGGDLPGLFDEEVPQSCRVGIMITALKADAVRASVWADEEGTQITDIPDFLNQLTPLVLGTDTAVTEHDYRAGHATAYDAVLQRGTAVLVTSYGVPAVKCVDANPLSPPEAGTPEGYSGASWPGFAPGTVTDVEAASTTIGAFRVVDSRTGQSNDEQSNGSDDDGNEAINSPLHGSQHDVSPPMNGAEALFQKKAWRYAKSSSSAAGSTSAPTASTLNIETQVWDPALDRWTTEYLSPADLSNAPCTPVACNYLQDSRFDPAPIQTTADGQPVLGPGGSPRSCGDPDTDTVYCRPPPGAVAILRFTQPISVNEATARDLLIEAGGSVDPERTYATTPRPPSPAPITMATPTPTPPSTTSTTASTTSTPSVPPETSTSTSTTSSSTSGPSGSTSTSPVEPRTRPKVRLPITTTSGQ